MTHLPPPLTEIGRAFALADVVICSVKNSGGRVRHGFVIATRLRRRATGATRETRRPLASLYRPEYLKGWTR